MPTFTVILYITVDFALKVIKWTDTQTIKLQLWDIAGECLQNQAANPFRPDTVIRVWW